MFSGLEYKPGSYSFIHSGPVSRIQLENSTEASFKAFNTQQMNLNAKLMRMPLREGTTDPYLFISK